MAYHFDDRRDHTIFYVGEDAEHHHVVQENHGRVGGTFASRAEAVCFAQQAAQAVPGALVLIAPTLAGRHAG
ncbi:hypothetical protein KX816_19280 [Sphingosinicellaceae bacterium]|nr:hypothetical protein KX816_19280 [Sphingosinicellaceae bacterium]